MVRDFTYTLRFYLTLPFYLSGLIKRRIELEIHAKTERTSNGTMRMPIDWMDVVKASAKTVVTSTVLSAAMVWGFKEVIST